MTATPAKKPASRKPALRVVGAPDLAQMESVVIEAAKQQAPIVQRATSVRDELVVKVKALESERSDLVDRQTLLTRQYQAAMEGLNSHIADIDAARLLYVDGLRSSEPAA